MCQTIGWVMCLSQHVTSADTQRLSVYVIGDVSFGHLYQVLSDFSTVLFFSLATDKQSVGETF